MAHRSPVALATVAALAVGLLAAADAAAQSWLSEPLGAGGARAYVSSGGATFAIQCTSGGAATAVYQPANIAGVALQPIAFSGQGPVGDGIGTGYLFFQFDEAAVQQFLRRDSQRGAFVAEPADEVMLRLLRTDNQLTVTPAFPRTPSYDSFSLRGSSRAINAALNICSAPPPAAPPIAPPNVAGTGPETVTNPPTAVPVQPPVTTPPTTPPDFGEVPPPTETVTGPPPGPPPLPPAFDAGASEPRLVGSVGDFVAMAEGPRCARSLAITVMAPEAAAFQTGRDALQQLIADVQAAVTAGCPDAQILRIAGRVGDTQVYDGVAARAALWTLIDLVLPGEAAPSALPAATPPAEDPPVESAQPDAPLGPPPGRPPVMGPPPEGPSVESVPPEGPPIENPPPEVATAQPDQPPLAPPGEGPPASSLFDRPSAPPGTAAPPTAAAPGTGVTCPATADPAGYATPAESTGDSYIYGRDDDAILVRQETGIFAHYAGTGDDTVYVFGGNAGTHISLDVGSDTLIFCELAEVSYSVAGGSELSNLDTDTDVIIFEPGAFRNIPEGLERGFFIYSISPINDRIVVRVPPDLDAELLDFAAGFPKIVVGDTVIQLSPVTQEPIEPIDPSMVIIERVPG